MKTISFWKMSGSGNDFVIIDNRRGVISRNLPGWAKRLCDRHEGIGADGLLLLEPSRRADFRMVYFNADGSRASMCGNGARCMAWFANQQRVVGKQFQFETDAYPVEANVSDRMVRISLADPRGWRPDLRLRAGGKTYRMSVLDTGVPHAVVWVSDISRIHLAEEGRWLRHHRAFGSQGANINFVQRLNGRTLKVRTYERGVEGETLACGTGVTASAVAASLKGLVRSPVRCVTAGGDVLEVRLELRPGDPRHPATHITLRGPVRLSFKGQFDLNGGFRHV